MTEKIEIRNEKGQLQKGSNLNPTGMDRKRALMLRKLESLTPRALAALERLVEDESNPTVRLGAAREILDRTMGKAKQSVTVDVTSSGALHLQALQELADRARLAEQRTIDITPNVQHDTEAPIEKD
jgi:hypothetical protein